MENQEISELIKTVIKDSPWQNENNKEWYLTDGSLREIMIAEELGLFEPPKMFYHLKKSFF